MTTPARKPKHDLTGLRFGRLTAISMSPSISKSNGYQWDCVCDCGQSATILAKSLRGGMTLSCGCLQKELAAERCRRGEMQVRTHGLSPKGNRHPLYGTWAAMWNRCRSPKHDRYDRYGGRGITVCDRWKDFAAFVADVGPKPSPSHTLDRYPNNDGNYEPGNVRWATPKQQANNRARATA